MMRSMGHLIGYARVSTADQDTAMQLDALKAAGCSRIFSESASGARARRPELTAALDYMREGDTLVVYKLDRLARSMSQLIATVQDLSDRKIELHSLNEAIDTTSPAGRFTFGIFAALAEFERDMIRSRTKAGLDAARARGRKGGRPRKLKDKDLAYARELLQADPPVPFAEVARKLEVSPATLYGYFPVNKRGRNGADAPELPLDVA
jgi:DNA invertase Pin-like site-specific DNA recombinase